MSAKYWIKLYHEILRDPKMMRMSDTLFRRTIEILLLAGETDKDGYLPDIGDMSWLLHVDETQLLEEMISLENKGILSRGIDGKWFVTHFTERQNPLPKSEYMARKRVTNRSYQSVTKSNTDTDTDTDTDKNHNRGDGDAAAVLNIFQLYEESIGVLVPMTAEMLKDAEGEYPHEWFELAFREAVKHNVRKWTYVEKILRNWKERGYPDDGVVSSNGDPQPIRITPGREK